MRTYRLAAFLAIVFVAGVGAMILPSCSASIHQPEASASATQPVETTGIVTVDADGATIADLRDYLNSPERSARYESFTKDAAIVVSLGLNDGAFGEPKRYTEMKQPRPDGYAGWGTVMATSDTETPDNAVNHATSARVYWNADGTIDETQVDPDVFIGNKDDVNHSKVGAFSPSPASEWWVAVRYNQDGTGMTMPYGVMDLENLGWGHVIPSEGNSMVWPSSLREVKEFDDTVLEQLEANMASWFGDDWRNYR